MSITGQKQRQSNYRAYVFTTTHKISQWDFFLLLLWSKQILWGALYRRVWWLNNLGNTAYMVIYITLWKSKRAVMLQRNWLNFAYSIASQTSSFEICFPVVSNYIFQNWYLWTRLWESVQRWTLTCGSERFGGSWLSHRTNSNESSKISPPKWR